MSNPRFHTIDQVYHLVATMAEKPVPYTQHSVWTVPESHTVESFIRLLCELARKNDTVSLDQHNLFLKRQNVAKMGGTQLTDWAAMVLAWEGNEQAVQIFLSSYFAKSLVVKNGYAWGGHFALAEALPAREIYALHGYALGRHIAKVNQVLIDNEIMSTDALIGYREGGHIVNQADTLELITLTLCRKLKESIASELGKRIPGIDTKAILHQSKKIATLMKLQQLTFTQAMAELNKMDKEKEERSKSSPGLFQQKPSSLSFYQRKAIAQLAAFHLTDTHLMRWTCDVEPCFSAAHFHALRYLIEKKRLSPEAAIQEINQLSSHEANALTELFGRGLRGQHFRQCLQPGQFNAVLLERLLTLSLNKTTDPVLALQKMGEELSVTPKQTL